MGVCAVQCLILSVEQAVMHVSNQAVMHVTEQAAMHLSQQAVMHRTEQVVMQVSEQAVMHVLEQVGRQAIAAFQFYGKEVPEQKQDHNRYICHYILTI